MSSPPEACNLKVIEQPYSQAFPPFCQVPQRFRWNRFSLKAFLGSLPGAALQAGGRRRAAAKEEDAHIEGLALVSAQNNVAYGSAAL